MRRVSIGTLLGASCVLLSGCGRNPNVDILGSYFPGWLVAVAAGVLLTGVTHGVLRRQALLSAVGHPALIYPCMVLLYSCLLWLCLFS